MSIKLDRIFTEHKCTQDYGEYGVGKGALEDDLWKYAKQLEGKLVEKEEWINLKAKQIEKLEHHETTTVGLWATDRPDLVKDPKKVMFEIKKR